MICTVENPLRPKDWREVRARQLGDDPPSRREGDYYLHRARKFFNEMRRITGMGMRGSSVNAVNDAHLRLWATDGDLYSAFEVRAAAGMARWGLEAMVLCEASVTEISDKVGITPHAVNAYENIYFDVRNRLRHQLFLYQEVIGPAMVGGALGVGEDFWWKIAALAGGQSMLEDMWSLGPAAEKTAEQLKSMVTSGLLRNAAQAVKVRPVTAEYAHDIIMEYIAMLQVEKEGSRDLTGDMAASTLAGMMGTIRLNIIGVEDTIRGPTELRAADKLSQLIARGYYDKEVESVKKLAATTEEKK